MNSKVLQHTDPRSPGQGQGAPIGLLLLAWLLLALPAGAQIDELEVVAELQLAKREPKPQWFAYSPQDGGLLTIANHSRHSSRFLAIYKYDDAFEREWRKRLFKNDNDRSVAHITVLGASVLVFVREGRGPQPGLYYYQYTLDGKELVRHELLHAFEGRPGKEDKFQFDRSLNKDQVLAFLDYPTGDEEAVEVAYYLFSRDSANITSGTLHLPYPADEMSLRQVDVSNTGELYALVRRQFRNRVREPGDAEYRLFYQPARAERAANRQLDFGQHFITDLHLKVDRNGLAMLAGFWSEQSTSRIIGPLYGRLDLARDTVLAMEARRFSEAFLQRYLSPKQIEKGRELRDFYLDDMILRSDGGMLILGERYFVSTSSFRDIYGFWYTRELLHYEDVLLISMSGEGQIEWVSAAEKSQSGEFARQLSYASFIGSREIYLFYRTHLKGFGANVYVRRVAFDGTVSAPKPFFKRFRNNDIFYRGATEQIANDRGILVYLRSRGKTFTMLKVAF